MVDALAASTSGPGMPPPAAFVLPDTPPTPPRSVYDGCRAKHTELSLKLDAVLADNMKTALQIDQELVPDLTPDSTSASPMDPRPSATSGATASDAAKEDAFTSPTDPLPSARSGATTSDAAKDDAFTSQTDPLPSGATVSDAATDDTSASPMDPRPSATSGVTASDVATDAASTSPMDHRPSATSGAIASNAATDPASPRPMDPSPFAASASASEAASEADPDKPSVPVLKSILKKSSPAADHQRVEGGWFFEVLRILMSWF